MAPPRKRNASSFTPPSKAKVEEAKVEELLDEVATEMFETISHIEEEPEVETPVEPTPAPIPVVIDSIVPTEDAGPRFVEEPAPKVEAVKPKAPAPQEPTTVPQLTYPPKRHPRNIPKYSRYK
jgi:hypothetical protein